MLSIYLAGPFFNDESKMVLYSMLKVLEANCGHKVWVPMRDGILCPPDADREMRLKVFTLDCEQLHRIDCVVALLDYPLPVHMQLCLRTQTPEGNAKECPMYLPDPGTIFEIGYTNGLNHAGNGYTYVIGYSSVGEFNLMVAEACDCIVSDSDQLERVMPLVAQHDDEALMLLKIQYQKKLATEI